MATMNLSGEWSSGGNPSQPCAISQAGKVLLLIIYNEDGGDIAAGLLTGENIRVPAWKDREKDKILEGTVEDEGRTIHWTNGTTWRKV